MARSRSTARNRLDRGFTLVEVLVAVSVLGIALAAIIKSTAENASNASYLRDKTFANWVAMNKITEMQVTNAWGRGSDDATVEFAGREWPINTEIEQLPNAGASGDRIRKVTVTVYAPGDEDASLIALEGFLEQPQ